MKYAVISDQKVVNIVIASEEFASENGLVPVSDNVQIGWIYDGNDFAEPPISEEQVQIIKDQIVASTQQRLDSFAQTRNYDGVLSLCTYASSLNSKFKAEGQYGVEARDATWAKLYEILAEVEAGTRPMPTGYADIEPELPVLVWPA